MMRNAHLLRGALGALALPFAIGLAPSRVPARLVVRAENTLDIARARSGVPVVQYIGAGWTGNGDYADLTDWYAYLTQEAQRLSPPHRVTVSR